MRKVIFILVLLDTFLTVLGGGLMGKAVTKETTLTAHEPGQAKQNPWKNVLSQPEAALLCFGRMLTQLKRWFKTMDSKIKTLGTEFWYSCHHYRKKSEEIRLSKKNDRLVFSTNALSSNNVYHCKWITPSSYLIITPLSYLILFNWYTVKWHFFKTFHWMVQSYQSF